MPRLDELANIALRVPSILALDVLYKCDIEGLTDHLKAKNEDMLFKYKYVIWNMYYLGKCACEEIMISGKMLPLFTVLNRHLCFDPFTSFLSAVLLLHIEQSPELMAISPCLKAEAQSI